MVMVVAHGQLISSYTHEEETVAGTWGEGQLTLMAFQGVGTFLPTLVVDAFTQNLCNESKANTCIFLVH
jgi:hypothetical protein